MIRPLKIDQRQFGAKVGRHMLDFGRNPANAADRDWLIKHLSDIYNNATEFRTGTFSGQGDLTALGNVRGPVWFYARGNDVVVTDKSDNLDRKSTRLNSSHLVISYAVFCLKKKNS